MESFLTAFDDVPDVTPQEAVSVMTVVEQFRRTLEITEIEARIAALEKAK